MHGCEGVGHPSSSVVMGIAVIRVVDMGLPDRISGPQKGWRFVVMTMPM